MHLLELFYRHTSRCCSRYPSAACILLRRTSSVRRQLEVITEETDARAQHYNTRRKQLIPRAKLAHQHRRAATDQNHTGEENGWGSATVHHLPAKLQYQKRAATGQGPIRYKYSSRQRVPEHTFNPPFVDVPLDSPRSSAQGFHEESDNLDQGPVADVAKTFSADITSEVLKNTNENLHDKKPTQRSQTKSSNNKTYSRKKSSKGQIVDLANETTDVIHSTSEENLAQTNSFNTQQPNDTTVENPPDVSEILVSSNSFTYKADTPKDKHTSSFNGRNSRITYSTGTYKVTTFGKRRRNRTTGPHIQLITKIFDERCKVVTEEKQQQQQRRSTGVSSSDITISDKPASPAEDKPHTEEVSNDTLPAVCQLTVKDKKGIYGRPRCANVVSVVVKRDRSPLPPGVVASSEDGVSTVLVPSGDMSRRPHILYVQDSVTTQRARQDDKASTTDTGYAVPRPCTAVHSNAADGEQKTRDTTRKMRSVFEGRVEKRHASSKAIQTSSEDKTTTKPMLIATLQTSPASSPTKEEGKKITSVKTPAFRAFSADGQESNLTTLRSITRSIPEYLNYKDLGDQKNSALGTKESKVAAFDGLLQYLQEYRNGLRELLVNNNVVIIEPIRQSSVRLEDKTSSRTLATPEGTCRITGATVKDKSDAPKTSPGCNTLPHQPILRRHFFYHPIKTNRALVDEELPDPDKVKTAREMFERTVKTTPVVRNVETIQEEDTPKRDTSKVPIKVISVPRAISGKTSMGYTKKRDLTVDTVFRQEQRRWTDSGSLSSGVSSDLSCYETDLESPRGCDNLGKRERGIFTSSSDDEETDEGNTRYRELDGEEGGHYVSAEILEKIRACGTSVTYYGGRVIAASDGAPFRSPMTLAIMDEIKRSGKKTMHVATRRDELFGVKFRLVKSNSCSSRLELAGTEEDEERISGTEAPASTPEPLDNDSTEKQKSCLSYQSNTLPFMKPSMICSPEKVELLKRGSKDLFGDMEFEEFEVLEAPEKPYPIQKGNDVKDSVESKTSEDHIAMTTWARQCVDFRGSADVPPGQSEA